MINKTHSLATDKDIHAFYRVCANSAVFVTIIASIFVLIADVKLHKVNMDLLIAGALPGTIALVILRFYFPRTGAFLLMLKFHISNAYVASMGYDINPWFTAINSSFFLMGYIETCHRDRVKKNLAGFWLSESGFLQIAFILTAGTLLTLVSSGYIFTHIAVPFKHH
jgi:hypothetical protein